ncbi:MAG TPA: GIY-YIG nuclease family protein [Chitinophagales bacterium]|nr:GIY-YIG nuclease family protein [Chitinophagales bacterium]
MKYGGCVYIMTNQHHSTLYTGVTSDLPKRIHQHKKKEFGGFTARYNCDKLVFYKNFARIEEAIAEEKRIKGGSRKAKELLIHSMNPSWEDLSERIDW